MSDIADFLEDRACPACGNIPQDISIKYAEKRQILNLAQRKFRSLGLIEKTCNRCGFSWPETPLHLIGT